MKTAGLRQIPAICCNQLCCLYLSYRQLFNRFDAAAAGKTQRLLLVKRIEQLLRLVRVEAEDDRIALLARELPEVLSGILPPLAHTEKIELQRRVRLPGSAAESTHLLIVERLVPGKVDEVGMGKATEKPRAQPLDRLIDIAL